MTDIASPFSTGGGGPNFESCIGAYYLAALLLQSVPRGQEDGITTEVRFQRLYDGDPLDDLIIVSSLPSGEAKLALQIKRDLTFGEKDETFDTVISACWETFQSSQFNVRTDRFGIVLGLYGKNIDEYYQSVLTWARTSVNSNDFLKRINQQKLSNQTQRSFVKLIRDKLDSFSKSNVSDDDLWNFLRSMVVLHFDFQKTGSRDYTYIVEIVSYILEPSKKNDSAKLISELAAIASRGNYTAGSFNAEVLRLELQQKYSLLPSPDCREDLRRLRQETTLALKDICTDIGGLTLSRTEIVSGVIEMMQESSIIGLTGVSGTGKSALLKVLAESRQSDGFVIFLSWDRITGVGWTGFANHLQLNKLLKDILIAISGSSQPTIFIDGIDRIEEEKQKIINDLLRTILEIPLSHDGTRHWTIMFSAREENLQNLSWVEWRHLGNPKTFTIPKLTQSEIQTVFDSHLRINLLLKSEKFSFLVENLFFLRLAIDPRFVPDINNLPPLATEIEISKVWWDKVVGDGNSILGISRKQEILKLGEKAIKSRGNPLNANDNSPKVLVLLEGDRILIREPNRDVYRFSHDLLEDWVICRVLDQHREELPAYLQELKQPFGLIRSVQLLGTFLLENETAEYWENLVVEIEGANALSPRWRQSLLTSPLLSPLADELLEKAKSLLLAEDAKRLIELMVTLRTAEVTPNFSLGSIFNLTKQENVNQLMPILMSDPIPRWDVWQCFMGWMLKNLSDLPVSIRPEFVKLMEIWQVKSPIGSIYRKEIAQISIKWLSELKDGENTNVPT